MLVIQPPMVTEVKTTVCYFHQRWPAKSYPGCTCSSSISARAKRPDEMTEAEKRAAANPFADFGENVY